MSFQSPLFLLGLAAAPLAIVAYWAARQRRQRYAVRFPGVPTLALTSDSGDRWRRHLPTALFALALAVLALALARPEATVAVPIERASVILVTDVSGSMAADDVDPSRLEAAKAAARGFLDDIPDELRVGAVAFSSTPQSIEEPSDDHAGVASRLDGLIADGGTATGDALDAALRLLESDGQRRPPAAIVLLSDGETTTGKDPVAVAGEARRLQVPVYTVALGTSSGTITDPVYGTVRRVPPDPETMREIARVSGGETFSADDAEQLDTVYERLSSQIGTKQEKREITAGFAAGGIVLMLASAAVSLRGFGRLP